MRRILIPILVVVLAQSVFAQVSAARLSQMDAVIAEAIANKKLPGAVVLVGRKGRIVWLKAYGDRAVEPAREPMTPDTIFDLASLTKVVAVPRWRRGS